MTKFLLTILANDIILSLIAVLVERLLIWGGFVRGSTILVALFSLGWAVVVIFINYGKVSFSSALLVIFIGSFGMNRYDLMKTLYKGRWWWKSEEEID